MVFGLFSGYYSDWDCHGYYTTSDEAERAAIQLNKKGSQWEDNYYVLPLECLDGTRDTYKGDVIFNYSVRFYAPSDKRGKERYEDSYPNISRQVFAADEDVKVLERKVEEELQKKINPWFADNLTCTWHTNHYLTDEQVLKIARDMIAEWRAEKEGVL